MNMDVSLLDNHNQRSIQELLLQYHVAPATARRLAQVELRSWTSMRLTLSLDKIHNPARKTHRFLSEVQPEPIAFIQASRDLAQEAATCKLALCVNAVGKWSLRDSNYVAISHVWEEGLQADRHNRGLPQSTLKSLFGVLRDLRVEWVWLDCLAIPAGSDTLTAQDEILKKDIINTLSSVYRNADTVIILDVMVMGLESRDFVDVALALMCGRWLKRLWTLQEICLARNATVLTSKGAINFKEMVRALRYLSKNENDSVELLGLHCEDVASMVVDSQDAAKFEQLYLQFARLLHRETQVPSLTSIALSCYNRRTGNDIDYARALFPLFGLEWRIEYTREQGMQKIYDSQKYYAKRMLLMHGCPRSSFRPGWAPSYLTGISGPIVSPEDELGDIEWTNRGLSSKWYTHKIASCDWTSTPNFLLVKICDADGKLFFAGCLLSEKESQASKECFFRSVSSQNAFLLTRQSSLVPEPGGLAINVLLVERDAEVEHANEAWVCFTAEAACAEGQEASVEVHTWFVLHESPVSSANISGKAFTRIARVLDRSSSAMTDKVHLLSEAIRQGDELKLRHLLQTTGDLSVKDAALHVAVLAGRQRILNILLHEDVDIEAKDNAGRTPLSLAVEHSSVEIVESLLQNRADPNNNPHNDIGCLNQAVIKRRHDVLQLLLENGADVNERDGIGWYPLFLACTDYQSASILLSAGADPARDLIGGAQAIHFAARGGQAQLVIELLDRGIDVDRREAPPASPNLGSTPLYRAIESQDESAADSGRVVEHEHTVEVLIKYGADPHVAHQDGWTPFLLAASLSNFRILEILVRASQGD